MRSAPARSEPVPLSDQLNDWLTAPSDEKTVQTLLEAFADRGFALLFAVLLAVPALPVPTPPGAGHVLEVIAVLLAVQLIVGRREVWLPRRVRRVSLDGPRGGAVIGKLITVIRWLERRSHPRLPWLLHGRVADAVLGLFIVAFSIGAFLSPPFTALDTLPALGGVLLSLGTLLSDALIAGIGVAIGVAGIVLALTLGSAAVHLVGQLF